MMKELAMFILWYKPLLCFLALIILIMQGSQIYQRRKNQMLYTNIRQHMYTLEIFNNKSTQNEKSAPTLQFFETAPEKHDAAVHTVLTGCSQICQNDIKGHPSMFFEFVRKEFDCKTIWQNAKIDGSRTGPAIPLNEIPPSMLQDFTYDSQVPISPYIALLDQAYLGAAAASPVWEQDLVDAWALQCAEGTLEGNYGRQETAHLLQGLLQVPNMASANVLVIGSENPWVEACILSTGTLQVTTLEYGQIDSRHSKIRTVTPDQIRANYSSFFESFDVIVTFSSVEHAGLGR
jgi:hypothetical protein